MGLFGSKKTPLRKTCHTYPTMMKHATIIPYLRKIQKIYKLRDTPLEFCWHQHFSPEISKFCYIKKYRYRLHFDAYFSIIFTLFESWKIVLINMVTTLMSSAKMATPDLLKIKVFWSKGCDALILCPWLHQKILLRDLNYNVDVVMRPKFGYSSISVR